MEGSGKISARAKKNAGAKLYRGTNANVFDRNAHNRTDVKYVYFYYVKFLAEGQPHVRHYEYCQEDPAKPGEYLPLEVDDDLMGKLLKVARGEAWDPNDGDPPVETGQEFDNIEWRHVSYIVLMVDSAVWVLAPSDFPEQGDGACVDFLTENNCHPNHSFLDAGIWRGDSREALYFTNYLQKDIGGTVLKRGQTQPFKFNVLYNVEGARRLFGDHPPIGFILDPGGTNFGPPLKP